MSRAGELDLPAIKARLAADGEGEWPGDWPMAVVRAVEERNDDLAVLVAEVEALREALEGCVEWMEFWHQMTLADARGDHENGMSRCNSAAFVERLEFARAALRGTP